MDLQLLGILAALLLSALFAGSETAFLSFNKVRFQAWFFKGKRGTRAVDFLNRRPERFLITTLTGNNLVNVIYSSFMALWLTGHGFSEKFILIVSPIILLIIGESIPKAIANQNADRVILGLGPVIFWIRLILYPIVRFTERLMKKLQVWLGIPERKVGEVLSRGEIAFILDRAGKEGILEVRTYTIMRRLLNMIDSRAKDLMTPRTRVLALKLPTSVDKARQIITQTGFTRLPCYKGSIDNIVGVIVAQDLLRKPAHLQDVIRPLPLVPESLPLVNLLRTMKKFHTILVGVIDEFGGFAGVVSMDDVAQELVGAIKDEYDPESIGCLRLSDTSWLADGQLKLSILTNRLGMDPIKSKVSSLGGFLSSLHGGIPPAGQEFELDRITFRVVKSTPRRVRLVRITLKDAPSVN